jgi:hypothetical protein
MVTITNMRDVVSTRRWLIAKSVIWFIVRPADLSGRIR